MAGRYGLPVARPYRLRRVREYRPRPPRSNWRGYRRQVRAGGLSGRSLLTILAGMVLVLAIVWPFPRQGEMDESGRRGPTIRLWDADSRQLLELPLEQYLLGVVAAEMPAHFPLEALKAQAVAARTLALRALGSGTTIAEEPRAHLSSDYRAGQAWKSPAALREQWGLLLYQWNAYRIRKAVEATAGVVLTYEGQLIFPAFHSTSGGTTENSENYWSAALPYLRSVESPYEAGSPYLEQVVQLSVEDVRTRLSRVATEPSVVSVPSSSDTSTQEGTRVGVVSRYPSGRVKLFQFEGKAYTGRQVREALGLPSSWFYVEEEGGQLRFRVRGYGHGVGLSQYGAAGMARRGKTYAEILTHYYQGVTLARAY